MPIEDIGAQFVLAEAAWFEDEQTLFVFYEIHAAQGLTDESVVELTFRTDEVDQPFIDLLGLPPVHQHLKVSCGPRTLCGSYSTHVELPPRQVDLQLRYHRESELTLAAETAVNLILSGEPQHSRSALVYGVFDDVNIHVQWRLRHQFPTIRNEHAQALGLRRYFRIDDVSYGTVPFAPDVFFTNVYGYGLLAGCPAPFVPHENELIETSDRAVFDEVALPLESSTFPHACSAATVTDALGEFTTTAFARKNPEVREAFSALETPITENVAVKLFLEVCADPRSELHRDMQMQRLFMGEGEVVCIDDYATIDFPSRLATILSEKIDDVRQDGTDMVLVIGLSRTNDVDVARRVEQALALVLPGENERSSPHVSGAFLYDTYAYIIEDPAVARLALWCPSAFMQDDLDLIPDTSARSCAVQPVQPLNLGELSLSSLPILPTEPQFENFIDKYGPQSTGKMTDFTFLAPSRTPRTTNIPVGEFGIATLYNNEAITAAPGDAFSYCAEEDTGLVVVKIEGFPDVLPLAYLGEVHAILMLPRYQVGLFWEFPFLLHAEYESSTAVGVDVPEQIPFAVGFGIGTPAEQFLGGLQWELDEFEIGDALLICTRYCNHPTFDSSGVYNVDDLFVTTYANACYRPRPPRLGEGGFPPDP